MGAPPRPGARPKTQGARPWPFTTPQSLRRRRPRDCKVACSPSLMPPPCQPQRWHLCWRSSSTRLPQPGQPGPHSPCRSSSPSSRRRWWATRWSSSPASFRLRDRFTHSIREASDRLAGSSPAGASGSAMRSWSPVSSAHFGAFVQDYVHLTFGVEIIVVDLQPRGDGRHPGPVPAQHQGIGQPGPHETPCSTTTTSS